MSLEESIIKNNKRKLSIEFLLTPAQTPHIEPTRDSSKLECLEPSPFQKSVPPIFHNSISQHLGGIKESFQAPPSPPSPRAPRSPICQPISPRIERTSSYLNSEDYSFNNITNVSYPFDSTARVLRNTSSGISNSPSVIPSSISLSYPKDSVLLKKEDVDLRVEHLHSQIESYIIKETNEAAKEKKYRCMFEGSCDKIIKGQGNFKKHLAWHLKMKQAKWKLKQSCEGTDPEDHKLLFNLHQIVSPN